MFLVKSWFQFLLKICGNNLTLQVQSFLLTDGDAACQHLMQYNWLWRSIMVLILTVHASS
jgi:hypothetical protein